MRELLASELMRIMEISAIDNETELDLDSLSRTEVAFFAEEHFEIELTDEEIKGAKNFEELIAVMDAK